MPQYGVETLEPHGLHLEPRGVSRQRGWSSAGPTAAAAPWTQPATGAGVWPFLQGLFGPVPAASRTDKGCCPMEGISF